MKLGLGSLEPRAKVIFCSGMPRRVYPASNKPARDSELNYSHCLTDPPAKRR
ncbi:hypothetical protein GGD40_006389 [Paraburkholderia bryophila]|uniref:Uncharacterized protein n=1 Tax=Paraburkholderia bryophila TaxID=420952 RepID=A0A7Y9WUR7_9BURK|nr:hypothetical protein [Paraburkholderia bryophila]